MIAVDVVDKMIYVLIGLVLFVFYGFLAVRSYKDLANKIAEDWCKANNCDFIKVDMHKEHNTLTYKDQDKKKTKKFRFNHFLWKLTWHEWLDK